MKVRKRLFLGLIALSALVVLSLQAGVGIGVGQDAYPVGDIAVSPGISGCVGETITLTGSGAPANTAITVHMNPDAGGATLSVALGTTMSDGAGNWSLVTTVPSVLNIGGSAAVTPGAYVIYAMDDASYRASSNFTVLDCVTVLPSTGLPLADAGTEAGMVGVGLLGAAGIGFRMLRRRR